MNFPKNWKFGSLGDFFDTSTGATPKKNERDNYGSDVPFVKPPELLNAEIGVTADNLSIKGASSSRTLPPGSILVSCIGNLGKVGICSETVAFNQQINAIKPNGEFVSKFMFYQVLSLNFREQLEKLASGTTVPIVNKSKFNSIKVVLPPIPEQKRIVAILDQAFADLEQVRAKTEQNLKNARDLFDSYLQQVFSQKGDGWVEAELFDHIKFIDYRGKTPKKTERGLRLITAKNVRMGYLKTNPEEFVSPESYDGWMTRGIPKKGDVLFTSEAPLANVAQLDTDDKVVFAQRIITMQPDRSVINCDFLKYLLMSPPIQQRIYDKGTGATVTGIKASLLKKIVIEFPSNINEQEEYAIKLNSLTAHIKKLESIYQHKLASIDELKKSILQKAFSGELTATTS